MTIRAYDHYMHTGSDYPGSGFTMENLHGIIKHCLVNGSGGVPAAGWNLEYDEGEPRGTFVLSNGDRDFFICFYRSTSIRVQVSIAATFEGVDGNGFIIGESARSGAHRNFTSPAFYQMQYLVGLRSTSRPEEARGGWSMLADSNTCSIVFASCSNAFSPGAGIDSDSSAFYNYGGGFSFGKTTRGFGYVSGAGDSSNYLHPAEGVVVINDPRTGLLIPSSNDLPSVFAYASGEYNRRAQNTATFIYEDQMMLPLEVYMQGSAAIGPGNVGRIRGFVQMPFVDKSLYPRHLLNALGMAADDFDSMRVQDLAKFRVGSDGYKYAYGKLAEGVSKSAQVFLTDNPMVW